MRFNNKSKVINANNKGVALISILIAVAFVSIIGSALLYITYTNFQMKVLNLRSKENFFETDGKLVDVTSAIRNTANKKMNTADSVLYKPVINEEEAIVGYGVDLDKILDLAGVPSTRYADPDIAGAISYQDPVTEDVFTYSCKSVIRDPADLTKKDNALTKYTIPEFTITQKSKDGYSNTVKTDIQFNVMKQDISGDNGRKGVGEFSFLFDSAVNCSSNGQFSFLTMYGDAYFSSYYYGSDDNTFGSFSDSAKSFTMPGSKDVGKPGLILTNQAKINMLGEYFVVYGDLILKDSSSIYIYDGALTVYGDIYLEDQSTLIVNGQIYQPISALPGRGGNQCGIYGGAVTVASPTPQHGSEWWITESELYSKYSNVVIETKEEASWAPGTYHFEFTYTPAGATQQFTGDSIGEHLFLISSGSKVNLNGRKELHPDDSSGAVTGISDDNYIGFCETLGLCNDTDNKDDDGIIPHIYETIKYKTGTGENDFVELNLGTTNLQNGVRGNGPYDFDYYDISSQVAFLNGDVVNGEYKNSLAFVTNGGSGFAIKNSNNHSTFISAVPGTLDVQHGIYMTKTSTATFNYLTQTRSEQKNSPYYNSIHHFELDNINGKSNDIEYSAGDFLKTDSNKTIAKMLGYAKNSGSSIPTYINSVSFSNYVKDPN